MSTPVIGVLGGGQLGQMLALAARNLGIDCRFYETKAAVPAASLGPVTVGSFDDAASLRAFSAGLDVITYEWENVPVTGLGTLDPAVPVRPSPQALEVAQDRVSEKTLFNRLGIPTAPYVAVDTEGELGAAVATLGTPAILKTRRLGYDGKGQAQIDGEADIAGAWAAVGGTPLILEKRVPWRRELSVIAVRGVDGSIKNYPLVENHHGAGILRVSVAPAPEVDDGLRTTAYAWIDRVLGELDYVGVLAIELFDTGDGLLASEMAPRVHNSGHWTIEGAVTSQFENHIRAVAGLPLGDTDATGVSCMVNLIGVTPPLEALLAIPGAHVHLYGKEPRLGRKLGHVTVCAPDLDELYRRRDAVVATAGS